VVSRQIVAGPVRHRADEARADDPDERATPSHEIGADRRRFLDKVGIIASAMCRESGSAAQRATPHPLATKRLRGPSPDAFQAGMRKACCRSRRALPVHRLLIEAAARAAFSFSRSSARRGISGRRAHARRACLLARHAQEHATVLMPEPDASSPRPPSSRGAAATDRWWGRWSLRVDALPQVEPGSSRPDRHLYSEIQPRPQARLAFFRPVAWLCGAGRTLVPFGAARRDRSTRRVREAPDRSDAARRSRRSRCNKRSVATVAFDPARETRNSTGR